MRCLLTCGQFIWLFFFFTFSRQTMYRGINYRWWYSPTVRIEATISNRYTIKPIHGKFHLQAIVTSAQISRSIFFCCLQRLMRPSTGNDCHVCQCAYGVQFCVGKRNEIGLTLEYAEYYFKSPVGTPTLAKFLRWPTASLHALLTRNVVFSMAITKTFAREFCPKLIFPFFFSV